MSQAGLSPLDHHLLGLVAGKPSHGYEIIEALEKMPWTVDVRTAGSVSVYQALAALQKRGWIALEKVPAGTSALRALYEITQAGQNALWLATEEALREFPTLPGFRRGIAYADVLSPGILAARLAQSHEEVARRLEAIKGSDVSAEPSARRSLIENDILMLGQTLEWLDELRQAVAEPSELQI